MLKVGLTGNAGSGVDEVGDLFKVLGVPVFDADIALKFIINYRVDVIRLIKTQFGRDVYSKNGNIDGSKFNPARFNVLLDIAEIELFKMYESWRLSNKNAAYTIFKSSILFERKINERMNYNINTFVPKGDRAITLSKGGMRIIDAMNIVESEMSEFVKNDNSTFVIHAYNSSIGANISIVSQAREIHNKIESKSIKKILDRLDQASCGQEVVRNIFM